MATVKEIEKAIKAHQYVSDSIAYILSPENRNGDEKCFRATCLNCANDSVEGLVQQFYVVRMAYNKNDNILSHHYVQSFSPNEKVTPEIAHKIGVELAEKVAPGFQVIVSTHVDKDHLHNHIIINSVSMETGMKWKADLKTRMNMRSESDKLCRKYGLTTIKNQSGLRGIDQTTQKLAEKGKSWKVELCRALDEAGKLCHDKEKFIAFMKRKGFEITRYTDRHITFQKIGETKKIRADTLAEQFGDYYTKENLELMMGFYGIPKPLENLPQPKPPVPFRTEFEKYEESYFQKNPPLTNPVEAKMFQLLIDNSNNPLFYLLLIIARMMFRRKNKNGLDRKYRNLHIHLKEQKQYKIKKPDIKKVSERIDNEPRNVGNIPYRNLIHAQGENYRVKLELSAIPKLYAYPFFFSVKIFSSYAVVTIKEKDKQLLQKALDFENEKIIDENNRNYTALADYNELKKRAEFMGVKPEFLMIEPSELEKLNDEKDRFVALSAKDGKIRLAFLPQNKNYILHALYPDKYESEEDIFSVSRNSKVNTKLKSEALLHGKQMRYRVLTKEQVKQLAENVGENKFAVFSKNAKGENLNGQYNIAFNEDDTEKVENALQNPKRKI